MRQSRFFSPLLYAAAFCLLLMAGCSSLPKETVQKTPRNTRAASFLELGHQQYRAGQYQKASLSFEKALASHASVDEGAGVAKSLSGLGRSQLALDQLDDAESSFNQAFQATRDLGQPQLAAEALGGLGAVQLHRQQPGNALTWFEKALELPLEDPGSTKATLLHDSGSAQLKLGNKTAAEEFFLMALAMHEPLRDLTGIATDCYSLALMHEADNNYVPAMEYARRALSHDKRAENSTGIALDLTLLGSLAEASGDNDQAMDYYRRARLAWKSLGQTEQVNNINAELQRIESP